MKTADMQATQFVIKGRVLSFLERPSAERGDGAYRYLEFGAIVVRGGRIEWVGSSSNLPEEFGSLAVNDFGRKLILPGFIDGHTHFSQMRVIASHGTQLLDWLDRHTFPEELRFSDPAHGAHIAEAFLDELTRHGVTTAFVYCTSHKESVDAIFNAARSRHQRLIAGKVMMDREAPLELCDTAQSSYDDSNTLIEKWHGKGRLSYAVTPRFAITSTPEQLEAAGALLREHPDVYLQTHLSENKDEIKKTAELYPNAVDYLGVYESFGLVGERSLFGHCIHLTEREISVLKEKGGTAVLCPSSNLFLGSGHFDYAGLSHAGVGLALGSDVGGGSSHSMLSTAADAYRISQMRGVNLDPLEMFYRLTLGSAQVLGLSEHIGKIEPGLEADLVVLDSHATPAMAIRMTRSDSLCDELFVLSIMGDDRSVAQTYISGVAML